MYEQQMADFYETDDFQLLSDSHDLVIQQLSSQNVTPKHVLDIGCGTGMYLEKMARAYPDAQLTGTDLSSDMLQRAQAKPVLNGLTSFVTDLQNIGLEVNPHSFDLISLHYVLCYVPVDTALPVIAGLLQSGGLFSLTTMTKKDSFPALRELSSFIEQEEVDALSHTPPSREDLKAYIEASGLFEIVAWDTLEKEISFSSSMQLSDFVFRSGWVSEVSEQYAPYIEQGLETIAFPVPEYFAAEIVLLRAK